MTGLPANSLAALGGALVMALVLALEGGGDPADGLFLYAVGIPAGIALSVALAWARPTGSWGYGFVYTVAQCATAFAVGGPGNLWPLALVWFAILALPMIAAALLTGWLRRRTT